MNEELKKELEEISPLLSNIPKEDIKAPEGYFDSFSSRVMARIHTEQIKQEPKIISIYNWKKYLVAAMLFVFMGLSVYIYKAQENNKVENISIEDFYLSELDESTIIEYTNNLATEEPKNEVDVYQQYLDEQTLIEEL